MKDNSSMKDAGDVVRYQQHRKLTSHNMKLEEEKRYRYTKIIVDIKTMSTLPKPNNLEPI